MRINPPSLRATPVNIRLNAHREAVYFLARLCSRLEFSVIEVNPLCLTKRVTMIAMASGDRIGYV